MCLRANELIIIFPGERSQIRFVNTSSRCLRYLGDYHHQPPAAPLVISLLPGRHLIAEGELKTLVPKSQFQLMEVGEEISSVSFSSATFHLHHLFVVVTSFHPRDTIQFQLPRNLSRLLLILLLLLLLLPRKKSLLGT